MKTKLPNKKMQEHSASFAQGVIMSARVSLRNYAVNQYGLTKTESQELEGIVKQLDKLSDYIQKRLDGVKMCECNPAFNNEGYCSECGEPWQD